MTQQPPDFDNKRGPGLVAPVAARVVELRAAFDRSFTKPLPGAAPPAHNLLAVHAGAAHVALQLDEISGLHSCPKLTPLLSPRPALLGLVGVRGRLLVVYRLAALLQADSPLAPPRWLVVSRLDDQLALGVDSIDGYLQVPATALHPMSGPADPSRQFGNQMLTHQGAALPVLSIAALVAAIRGPAQPALPVKES